VGFTGVHRDTGDTAVHQQHYIVSDPVVYALLLGPAYSLASFLPTFPKVNLRQAAFEPAFILALVWE
jgi:hypothetical protein